jgi:radical SAM protein with 4Fe4S-binding SPASM domain
VRVPVRLTIETIFGCNASCIMCPIDFPARRKKQVMPSDLYRDIVDRMSPWAAEITKFDLFGLGEPLLDPHLFDRIRYARSKGFHHIGISTNADPLNAERRRRLLDSGIDTVIFSVDGIDRDTHEGIRVNTHFDRVVANCLATIRLRDEGGYGTRFVIRFIRQPRNYDQWDRFQEFWLSVISPEKNDFITLYDAHTWGGKVAAKAEVLKGHFDVNLERMPCHLLNNLIVLSDGSVPLCCEDWLDSPFRLGNVRDRHPMEIFNSRKFERIREVHAEGRKNAIPICRECTVLHSEATRVVVTGRPPSAS